MNLVEHKINKLNQKRVEKWNIKEMFVPSLISISVDVKKKAKKLFNSCPTIRKKWELRQCELFEWANCQKEKFPTGLITKYLNIALPHSECEYVRKAIRFVYAAEEPNLFLSNGDNQE